MTDLTTPFLGKNPALIPISNSEMKCYKYCKRKWYLEYYRGLRPKKRKMTGPLTLGTRVHESLEQYYAFERPLLNVYSELADIDRLKLLASGEYIDETILKTFDSEAELGRVMLEGYLEWVADTGADENYTFVAAEKKISAMLMEGRVELRGKLDMKVQRKNDGVRNFIDFKTAASLTAYDTTAHMDEQLQLYQLLEAMNGEESRTDGGVFRIIKKTKRTEKAKPPFYRDLAVRFNKTSLNSFWVRVHGVIGDMLATRKQLDDGVDHKLAAYPSPNKDCHWMCPMYAVCPLFDDGSAAEEMLEHGFEQDDAYARYEDAPAPG